MNRNETVFELWRQDDNGNRFLVGTFDGFADAEHRRAELARCLHKQIYWITECRNEKSLQENKCR